MKLELKTLLYSKQRVLPCSALIPEVPISEGKAYERLYGMDGKKITSGFWDGRAQFRAKDGRDYVIFGKNQPENVWLPIITLHGAGFLSNIFGLSSGCKYRITVDGADVLLLSNVSKRMKGVLWGEHHTGKSNKHPSGYYFHDGFGVDSRQYLANITKGAVRFDTQLKIEYLLDKRIDNDVYLAMDYVMDSEVA